MSDNPAEEAVVIQAPGARMFGMFYRPAGETRGSILFCDALAEERRCSCRAMVETARAAAAAGWAVLRFDYRCCGDSEGDFADLTLDGMEEDAAQALEELERRGGAGVPEAVLGLRLGASIALRLAATHEAVSALALWEPVLDGRAYLTAEIRRFLVKDMMTSGAGRRSVGDIMRELEQPEAVFDLAGHSLSGRFAAEICALDAAALEPPKGDALLCQVSHSTTLSKPLRRYEQRLSGAGVRVRTAAIRSQAFWTPIEATSCPDLLSATVDWLGGLAGERNG